MNDFIIAADEVGRGCFAGDVHVAAVLIPTSLARIAGVDDSKKLSAKKRESLYGLLTTHPDISWSLVSRSVADIDRMGIDKATTEAFIQAVQELQPHQVPEGKKLLIKIDGRPIWAENKFDHKTVFITHGDATEWEIGAASIIAKVARDRYMDKLSVSHPEYKWEKNKGYGTADHIEAIRKHGLTPYHRKTFCRNYMTSAPVLEAQRELDDVLSMFK